MRLERVKNLDHLFRSTALLGIEDGRDGIALKTRQRLDPGVEFDRLHDLVGIGMLRVDRAVVAVSSLLGLALLERLQLAGCLLTQLCAQFLAGALHQRCDALGNGFFGEVAKQGRIHALLQCRLGSVEVLVGLALLLPGVRTGLGVALGTGQIRLLLRGQLGQLRAQGFVLAFEGLCAVARLGQLLVGDRVGTRLACNRCASGLVACLLLLLLVVGKLLAVPARVRFLSMEPLMGPVELRLQRPAREDDRQDMDGWCTHITTAAGAGLHWVIVGGESGPGARPMSPDWARNLRDQCEAAGVPFLFKQWGEWLPMLGQAEGVPVREKTTTPDGWVMGHAGKKAAGRLLDGRTWDGYPAP